MKRLTLTFAMLLFTATCYAASVGTVTHQLLDTYKGPDGTHYKKHKITMQTSSNGQAYNTATTFTLSGKIRLIYVDHDGTAKDNFDIYLLDSDKKDWLYGDGKDFDDTNADNDNQRYPVTADTGATIYVPNMSVYTSCGNSTTGSVNTIYFYIIEE